MSTITENEKALDHRKELEGRKFRFEVKSAEEAVALIRERLGETAKVLSVKQLEGKGLGKFLSSPRLEIVAEVPVLSEKKSAPVEEKKETAREPAVDVAPPTPQKEPAPVVEPSAEEEFTNPAMPDFESAVAREEESARSTFFPNTRKPQIETFLLHAGFPQEFINILQTDPAWSHIKEQEMRKALASIYHWMREKYQNRHREPLGKRVAFIGTPGTGKTSSLCRLLSHQVFHEKLDTHVVKLDGDNPNPDDSLAIFCDIMGSTILRDLSQVSALGRESRLLLDTGGISLQHTEEWEHLRAQLDEYEVWSKVLVINASYDMDLIKKTFSNAASLGITHFALSHLDEVGNSNKLWPLVLFHKCTPLLVNYGQNITSEYSLNVFDYLLGQAFPRDLLA